MLIEKRIRGVDTMDIRELVGQRDHEFVWTFNPDKLTEKPFLVMPVLSQHPRLKDQSVTQWLRHHEDRHNPLEILNPVIKEYFGDEEVELTFLSREDAEAERVRRVRKRYDI